MLNPFAEIDWNPDLKARRAFALSLIVGFPCLAALFAIVTRLTHGIWSAHFATLALLGLLTGAILWLVPRIARPFYLAWYFLSCCVGVVMGNVVLVAVYYFIVTPIGLLVRFAGRSAVHKNPDRGRASYWREPERIVDPNHYYRQF